MQFISCAPNCIDVLLWRAFEDVHSGVYIDFNPSDIEHLSVTRTFYNLGWRGVNIHQDSARLLSFRRPKDTNVCVSDEGYLASVWGDHKPSTGIVHFAHIASDGVNRAFNNEHWHSIRPRVLVIALAPSLQGQKAIFDGDRLLTSNGYRLAYTDDSYRLYADEGHIDLLNKLKHPPNIFDNFKLGVNPTLMMTHVVSGSGMSNYLASQIASQRSAMLAKATTQRLERSLSAVDAELQAVKNELQTLHASTSWKITAPLRQLVTAMGIDLPRAIRHRVKALLRRLALRLDRHPTLVRGVRRLVDRMPSLRRKLSQWAGVAAFDGATRHETHQHIAEVGDSDAMPVRAQQIYADLQAAILNKKEG